MNDMMTIIHKSALPICIVVLCLSSCVTSKYKVGKIPLNKHFSENPIFTESHTGLVVFDVDKDKVLFDYNGQRHFTPASNTKLLTYYAAIRMLPDSIPAIKYCVSNDTLFFSGTGDPTLLYDTFDYGKTLGFLREYEEPLVYSPRSTTDKRFGPGWAWDDYPYYYSAEKSSFPIYGNVAYFKKKLTQDHVEVLPNFFENRLQLQLDKDVTITSIDRTEAQNDFVIKFNSAPFEFDDAVPIIYSDDLFVNLLSDTLDQEVLIIDQFPKCKAEFLYSVPTDSVSKYILINSDNFLAEQMLLAISNQLGDTLSSRKSIKFMMDNYLAEFENEIYWVDGSGLSRYNQLTPNALIYVLKKIYQDVPSEKLYRMMPESGKSGTLKTAFSGLTSKIHAKTGSMSHVYNLSGFMETNSGKTLLFSFMNNNFNVSFTELKLEMEKILSVFIND